MPATGLLRRSTLLAIAVTAAAAGVVKLHGMVTLPLGGAGTISHVINSTGAAVNRGHQVEYLVSGP